MLSDGNSVSDKIGNILKIFGMAILCFVVFLTIYCGFVSVLIYCCSSKRIGRIFASKSEIPENRAEISERRHRERNNQYGNTGSQVFMLGVQNWKYFCLKIQSYEIKSPPWTILWFRILGIFFFLC